MSDKIGKFGKSDIIVISAISIVAIVAITFTVKQIRKNNERKRQIASVINLTGEANPAQENFCCVANTLKENFCANNCKENDLEEIPSELTHSNLTKI